MADMEAQIESFWSSFQLFDADGDGTITTTEFKDILKQLGMVKSSEEVTKLIRYVTAQHDVEDPVITFEQFCSILRNESVTGDDEPNVLRCFASFDRDNTGKVVAAEIKHVLLNYDGIP